jgi:thiamine biosynthesis lipoprotein
MQYLIIVLLFLTACNSKKEVTSFSGTQMTIAWEVKIAQKLNAREKARINEAISTTFSTVDNIFNNWNPYSEISKLNQMGAHQKVTLSEELTLLLEKVNGLVTFTEGRFDPTIEPLQKLYKASFAKGTLPHKRKLQALEPSIGWNNIHLEGRTFWKDHPKTAIDLGGVAKGYTVDLITETLMALGYHNFYVEWGGEIKTRGCHQDGTSWRIGIIGASIIEMGDEAIATSGDLFQRWTIDGITYTHIFDPQTKRPLEITSHSIPSVSVKGLSCAEADAIATCLMLFPTEDEAQHWANERNLSTWIISRKHFLPKE